MGAWPVRPARSFRTHHIVAAFIPALIVVMSISGFVWAHKQVTVVVDGRPHRVITHGDTVAEALTDAGVIAEGRDVVTPGPQARIGDGDTVVVRHAVPVTLEFAGETVDLEVVGTTVADALVAIGVDPALNPAIEPGLDAQLEPNMTITAPEAFIRVEQESATVPFAVEYRPDAALPAGERAVVQSGTAGEMVHVYRIIVSQGVESGRTLTKSHVVRDAVPQIVAVGTARIPRLFAASARTVAPPVGGRRMTVVTTAYSRHDAGCDEFTATGATATRGVVAVDPRVIPLGTRLYVPGYGYAVAADTGGAIKGNRIDVCFDTRAECMAWGRRTLEIIILP